MIIKLQHSKLQVLVGPNGSGKTTLVTNFVKKNKGVFLGFQKPVAVPGVTYNEFLRAASKTKLGPLEFYQFLKKQAKVLKIPDEFLVKDLNSELSGGEKKKMELFQALVLKPKFAIFDEPDSGVDSKNKKLLVRGLGQLLHNGTGVLVITHDLKFLKPLKIYKAYKMKNGRLS